MASQGAQRNEGSTMTDLPKGFEIIRASDLTPLAREIQVRS